MKIIFLIQLIVLVVVYFFILKIKINMIESEVDGVKSLYPQGEYLSQKKRGWQGYVFSNSFRLFYQDFSDVEKNFTVLIKENLEKYQRKKWLSLFDKGIYVFHKQNKGYFLVCVFRKDNRIFWADMTSKSTLDYYKKAFDDFILNIEISGEKTDLIVRRELLEFESKISVLDMQNPDLLILFIGAIFLLTLMLIHFIMRLSGRCPLSEDHYGEFYSEGATIITKKFGRKSSPCCVCHKRNFLIIYKFKKEFLKIDLDSEKEEISFQSNFLLYKSHKIILAENEFQKLRLRIQ